MAAPQLPPNPVSGSLFGAPDAAPSAPAALPPNPVGGGFHLQGGNTAAGRGPTVGHTSGGNFFTSAGHWLASKASLAGHDIKGMPAGILYQTEAGANAVLPHLPYVGGLHVGGKHFVGIGNDDTAPYLGTVVSQAGQSLKTALEHPLRDPFNTLMWVLPGLHGLGHAGAGVAEASGALRAGDVGAAAKALRSPKILNEPRSLTAPGGEPVSLEASRNALRRLYQHAHDTYVQKMIDTRPESIVAKYGASRMHGTLSEVSRANVRFRQAIVSNLRRAAQPIKGEIVKAAKSAGLKLENDPKTLGQAAIELVSHNTTPEEAIIRAEHAIEQGVNPELNAANVRLYREVQQLDLVHNHGLDVGINPEFTKLAGAEHVLNRGGTSLDEEMVTRNLRPEDQLAARRDLPAAVTKTLTPLEEEHVTPALRNARDTYARIDRIYQKALDQEAAWRHGRGQKTFEGERVSTGPGQFQVSNPYRNRVVKLGMQHEDALARLNRLEARAGAKATPKPVETIPAEQVHEALNAPDHEAALSSLRAQAPELLQRKFDARYGNASAVSEGFVRLYRGEPVMPEPPSLEDRVARADYALRYPIRPKRGTYFTPDKRIAENFVNNANNGYPGQLLHVDVPRESLHNEGRNSQYVLPQEIANKAKPFGDDNAQFAKDMVGVANGTEHDPELVRNFHQLTSTLEGRTFTPLKTLHDISPSGPMARSQGPVIGLATDPLERHMTTGKGLLEGVHQEDVTDAVARHWHNVFRFFNTQDWRDLLTKTGSDTRRSTRDILVRVDNRTEGGAFQPQAVGKIDAEIKQELGKARDTSYTPEMEGTDAGIVASIQQYTDHLFPGRDPLSDEAHLEANAPAGTAAPKGFKWVDSSTVGELDMPTPKSSGFAYHVGRFFDNLNGAVTGATVYFKIGHFGTRYLTNAATNIMQGSAAPLSIKAAVEVWHDLSPDERLQSLSYAGTHYYEALPGAEGESRVSRAIQHGIGSKHVMAPQWWAAYVDSPFRFNSLAYEVRKSAYGPGVDAFRRFLGDAKDYNRLDAAQRAEVDGVLRRGNREAIAYDRMNAFEKKYLARAVWFYPWVKGSTVWTGNAILEHPFKSSALAQAGVQGRELQQSEIGDVPSYSYGVFLLTHGRLPLAADWNTFNPMGTAGDVLQIPAHADDLAGMLNPALGAAQQVATSTDQFGNHTNHPLSAALQAAVASTPEAQIVNAIGGAKGDQSHREYPAVPGDPFSKTWVGETLRMLIGPGAPRRFNPDAAHSLAQRERTGR